MGDPVTPARATVIDGLLLALSHSELQGAVSTDLFKTILNIEYAGLVETGALDLQALWELLEEDPGFDPEAAVPPMCALQSWSERFQMEVVLPEHLRELSERELALARGRCGVPSQEVRRVFEREQRRQRRTSMAVDDSEAQSGSKPRPRRGWRERRELGWVASAVAALAFGFVAFTLIGECRSAGGWQGFDVTEFSAGIPLGDAEQLGDQVSAVLADPSWLKRPAAERRDQMKTALRGLSARKVEVLVVRDAKGRVRATAQWRDGGSRIRVELR